MSELDDLIVNFKSSMAKAGLYVNGNEDTYVDTISGPIPTLAKQVRLAQLRVEAALPNLANVLMLDDTRQYDTNQQGWGRKNLGIDRIDNTADVDKPMSTAVQLAVAELISQIQDKENGYNKNIADGYPGYEGYKLWLLNTDGNAKGYFQHTSTADRTWDMPDKSGKVALLSDITGTNTGVNTGDETQTTLLNKLGVPALSGTNTGDFDSVVNYPSMAALPNTGVKKRVYILEDSGGLYFWNGTGYQTLSSVVVSTDSVNEGTNNKYFTQMRAIQSILAAYIAGSTGVVDTSDTVVNAISKLQTQISAAISDYTTKLTLKEVTGNKATDFTTVNHTLYPSVQAVKTYADALVTGVIKDCGNWDASVNQFPTAGGTGIAGAIKKGNLWYVSVAGTLGGVTVNIGDSFRAVVDNPGQTASNWAVLESNLGYVPYNASNPAGYISDITSQMVTDALSFIPLNATEKNAQNGVAGLSGYAVVMKSDDGAVASKLSNQATAARSWVMPDKDGVVALLSDVIAGSGSDETQETILAKLGATQVTGSNTGDQTIELTGDITGSGTGSFLTTITARAVSFAKMAQVATATLLGRSAAGSGDIEPLTAAQAKLLLGLDQVDNTSDANKPFTVSMTVALSSKESLSNKAVDFSVVNDQFYPTVKAVKTYVDGQIVGAVFDCGNWDASSGVYPSAGGTGPSGGIKKGNLFFISGAGVVGGISLSIGDSIRALVDNPGQVNTNWDTLETNIGYVPYNASNPAGYISGITGGMVTTALGYTPINPNTKDASGGVVGLTGYKFNIKNSAGTVTSTVESAATAARAYVMPDKSGTVAMTSDITGTNSGTNTGDETQATILNKLGATAVTGSNTGDETGTSIRSKLGVTTLSGSNTGDETQATILSKLTYTPLNKAGDSLTGALNYNVAASIVSAATVNLSTASSNVVEITGTTTITGITLADGQMRMVRFAAALTLTNSANLVIPTGANVTTAPGDWAVMVGRAGGVVHVSNYMRASGTPLFGNARDKVRNITANTATTTIDLNTGDEATVFKVTIAANTTITFTNPPPAPSGEIFNFTLITINDATAGRSMSFGNTIQWANKTLPPRTTTANAKDVWGFYVDGGVYAGALSIEDQG